MGVASPRLTSKMDANHSIHMCQDRVWVVQSPRTMGVNVMEFMSSLGVISLFDTLRPGVDIHFSS